VVLVSRVRRSSRSRTADRVGRLGENVVAVMPRRTGAVAGPSRASRASPSSATAQSAHQALRLRRVIRPVEAAGGYSALVLTHADWRDWGLWDRDTEGQEMSPTYELPIYHDQKSWSSRQNSFLGILQVPITLSCVPLACACARQS
jgi:hypothetical protein